jgi:CheY-like chemotaxis protein
LQVLVNLLVNASKYSGPHTRIDFSVSLEQPVAERREGEREPTTRPEAVLRVRDYGVGIDPEQISQIFDLFVQADRTIDRADGGLGVGLTLVKVLVELHGGTVIVVSEGVGKGSEFCVRIPTCAPPVVSTPTGDARPPTDGRQKVLLIEDNADASRMLAFLLEEAGFEVATASDGVRGLEMITSTQPDAAVIDIGLPGMSGYELARAIRNDRGLNGIRLIALTGYGQSSDRAEAFAAGFDEHVVKPVDPELLCRLLGGGAAERGLVEESGLVEEN